MFVVDAKQALSIDQKHALFDQQQGPSESAFWGGSRCCFFMPSTLFSIDQEQAVFDQQQEAVFDQQQASFLVGYAPVCLLN